MEKRITRRINDYFKDFKLHLKECIENHELDEVKYNNILQTIYDYPQLEITKVDFTKRKRVKNVVPFHERCCALRANNEQCTRRKKDDEMYCGTHIKGRPHGEINNKISSKAMKKKEIWAIDIKGIIYFIDSDNNVYDHDDILNGVENSRIIAKYIKTGEVYDIPSLFKKNATDVGESKC